MRDRPEARVRLDDLAVERAEGGSLLQAQLPDGAEALNEETDSGATPSAPAPPPAPADPTRSLRSALRGIGTIVAPTSAVTALLFYFGWVRTNIEARALGLDDSLLGYSTQDYLLRSLTSMFGPLVVGLVAVVTALSAHAMFMTWASRTTGAPGGKERVRRGVSAVTVGLGVLTVGLLIAGLAGVAADRPSRFVYVASPVCVTVGLMLGAYGATLFRSFLHKPDAEAIAETRVLASLRGAAVVLLFVLSLFWNVSHFAAVKGQSLAEAVERALPSQPSVVLYSAKRLDLQPPVTETKLVPDGEYGYSYSGLKLLFRSGDKYFLRPADPNAKVNIVIPDKLDIRMEFS